MSQAKFVSNPDKAVYDSLCGLQKLFPAYTVDAERRIVISNKIAKGRVCLLSGGGSGHEPNSAGFVGEGMLSGSVGGLVFASPPSNTIFAAIRTLAEQNDNAGVLVLLMNYTGDFLNFGLASEEAKTLGIKVETVAMEDDCSILRNEVQGAGRRGMTGTVVAMKIIGHLARSGKNLTELVQEFFTLKENVASFGCAVSACTVPGVGPLFQISNDEVEVGVGIHGEAGVQRIQRPSIDELIEIILRRIIEDLELKSNATVCVFLNNAGATSQLEMGIIIGKIHSNLSKKDITVKRMYSGDFITSLDMAGFQICILNVTNNPAWVECLDSCTDAPAWPSSNLSIPPKTQGNLITINDEDHHGYEQVGPKFTQDQAILFKKCLNAIAKKLIEEESRMNDLDTLSGDGDAGSTLKRFAESLLKILPEMNLEYPASSLYQMSKLCQNEMGGSSGGIYGIFLTSAAKCVAQSTALDIAEAWKAAIDTVSIYSKAKVGDRTMMDVIIPCYEEFDSQMKQNKDGKSAMEEVVKISKVKCEETRHMKPRLGRASYVPAEYIKDVDPVGKMKIIQNKLDDDEDIMSQVKFISDAERAVEDALIGLKCAYPALYVDKKNRIVLSNQISKNRVALLSGGGSGHEPFSIGFVGNGMLSGAVAGLVFASPPTRTILAAIRTLAEQNENAGVLVIVLNYTGDILNFGLAVESAKADDIDVEMVVINEDCSRINEEIQGAGRRGLCGNCFIFKIAGNMAKRGIKLSYIAAECRQINDLMSTLGATVSSCTVPGVGSLFDLGPDEVEIGLGVHGEVGTCRRKLCTIDELVNLMVSKIIASLNLTAGSNVCVVINNLGSISHLEIGIICNKVYNCLIDLQITPCRLYSGSIMTSLDMAGFQISILNITEHPDWLEHLDANTDAPGWPGTCISVPFPINENKVVVSNETDLALSKMGPKLSANEASLFEKCLCSIANVFIQKEEFLNKLDTFSGEREIGSSLRRFSECILQNIPKLDLEYPAECFFHMSRVMQNIGGQSCTLYSILLASATRYLASTSNMDWLKMWKSSLDSLVCYSKAKIGDRTMVDVLVPVYDAFYNNLTNKKEVLSAFEDAVNVGKINCEKTRFMKPKASTSTASENEVEDESIEVECGAFATTLWLEAIHRTINNYFFE